MKHFLRTLLALTALPAAAAWAQPSRPAQPTPPSGPMALSLQQAVDYAVKNKPALLATRLGEQTARARVGEIKSAGLPQVTLGLEVADNVKLQKSLVDFSAFGGPQLQGTTLTQSDIARAQAGQSVVLDPAYKQAEAAPPQAIAFGLQYTGSAGLSASQLLFDGSYLIGLKAAKVYEDLARKQTQQAEIDVVEQVSKAYYSTLVARERLQLLARNVRRLDTILYQTNQTYKAGFVEKLDVQRLQVQRNNLVVEQQKAQRLTELSVALLKFQMGLDQSTPVELTDALSTAVVDAEALSRSLGSTGPNSGGVNGTNILPAAPPATNDGRPAETQRAADQQTALSAGVTSPLGVSTFNYGNRVEYAQLETQQALADLDLRNRRAGAYPRLLLTGRYGFNGSDPSRLRGLFDFRGPDSRDSRGFPDQNWFGFGTVGISLQVPVFDGFRRKYLTQQARITQQTLERGFETLRQSIDLQDAQSRTTLQNALDVLQNQKANLTLAEEVARVSRIKFKEGVGSNLEIVSAETDLREAQTNYYAALYDVLVSKVDRDKATGELYRQAKN